MKKFNLQRDEQIKVWVNRSLTVKAETLEEAIKIAQIQYPDDSDDIVEWGDNEVLWDTEEVLKVQVAEADEDINRGEVIDYDNVVKYDESYFQRNLPGPFVYKEHHYNRDEMIAMGMNEECKRAMKQI